MSSKHTLEPESPEMTAPCGARPVVFFDGACPLCRREIAHYRRLDKAARLHWVDAASATGTLSAHGLAFETAMAELHVLDVTGHWQRSIDAFMVIWSHLPGYRWLARLVAVLGLRHPLGFAYRHFAAWRYRRRCDNGSCPTASTQILPRVTKENAP